MQGSSDAVYMLAGLIELAEFALLAVLGGFLMKVIYWETTVRNNRGEWIAALRANATQLRRVRQQVERAGGNLPSLPLPPSLQKKWKLGRWIWQALTAAKGARS
jgi:hypothetical protein